jgi:hypothetical protein
VLVPQLALPSHCETRPKPPSFAIQSGFTYVDWLDADGAFAETPPRIGVPSSARVASPFDAHGSRELLALYVPPRVAANGWDEGDAQHLASVRLVQCSLVSVGARTEGWGRPAQLVELTPTRISDPMHVAGAPLPTDLAGTLVDPHPREKLILVGVDRLLVQTTMQGDINYAFWLRRDRPEIFLLEDTSICQGYFYSGNGLLTPALYEKLIR